MFSVREQKLELLLCAILAVAFALNDLSNQIDDNKDDLSSIKTDTTTLSNLFDDFSEEQANVCKLVRIFEFTKEKIIFAIIKIVKNR